MDMDGADCDVWRMKLIRFFTWCSTVYWVCLACDTSSLETCNKPTQTFTKPSTVPLSFTHPFPITPLRTPLIPLTPSPISHPSHAIPCHHSPHPPSHPIPSHHTPPSPIPRPTTLPSLLRDATTTAPDTGSRLNTCVALCSGCWAGRTLGEEGWGDGGVWVVWVVWERRVFGGRRGRIAGGLLVAGFFCGFVWVFECFCKRGWDIPFHCETSASCTCASGLPITLRTHQSAG